MLTCPNLTVISLLLTTSNQNSPSSHSFLFFFLIYNYQSIKVPPQLYQSNNNKNNVWSCSESYTLSVSVSLESTLIGSLPSVLITLHTILLSLHRVQRLETYPRIQSSLYLSLVKVDCELGPIICTEDLINLLVSP